ncbi:MAG: Mrp/NBP35 family ATP-binding protein [Alphaproteobacteria bacterium]
MSTSCHHNCASCAKKGACADEHKLVLNAASHVKKVIAVVSGKGGVGKSITTALLASTLNKQGFKTAILDADITGPSIPKMFGVHQPITGSDKGILPAHSTQGVKLMSLNLLLENETDPVLWRGPMITGALGQFWTDVYWGDIDYLFIDMPPGTGDVAMTIFQSFPIDGIIMVSSPQQLVSMIVQKALKMVQKMNLPCIGLVENMAYVECRECGQKYYPFGPSCANDLAKTYHIPTTAQIPMNACFATAGDKGTIETIEFNGLNDIITEIKKM